MKKWDKKTIKKIESDIKAVKAKPKFCSICTEPIAKQRTADGVVYWEGGHNAEPVNGGRCCSICNNNVVIPARLSQFGLKIDLEN